MSRHDRNRRSLLPVMFLSSLYGAASAQQLPSTGNHRIGEPSSRPVSKEFYRDDLEPTPNNRSGRAIREPSSKVITESQVLLTTNKKSIQKQPLSNSSPDPVRRQEIVPPKSTPLDIVPPSPSDIVPPTSAPRPDMFPSLTIHTASSRKYPPFSDPVAVLPTNATTTQQPRTQTVAGVQGDQVYWQTIATAREQLRHHAFLTAEAMGWNVIEELAIRRADELRGDGPIVALATAKDALREAGDFLGRYGVVDGAAMQRMVEAHQTPALKEMDLSQMTANIAADTYFDLARRKLMEATGGGSLAAKALSIIADTNLMIDGSDRINRATAITCLRAAVGGHPQSHQLANQLGYELLVDGRLEESEQLLKHALSLAPSRSSWQNLAELHRRRGELDHSQACIANAMALPDKSAGELEVLELSPHQFAALSPNAVSANTMTPQAGPVSQQANPPQFSPQQRSSQHIVPQRQGATVASDRVQTVPNEPSRVLGRVASLFSGWR